MDVWKAAVLGVVQGLTEFLPISSTAHLLVTGKLLGENLDNGFSTVIQLGTLLAVFVYFRRDLWAILKAVLSDLKQFRFGTTSDSRLAWLMILATVPAGLCGVVLSKWIKSNFYDDPLSIGVIAIVFSLLMAGAELWYAARRREERPEIEASNLTWKEALWIGVWQAFALLPGASRSGTTISGALFAGLSRPSAARVSFILSLPAILAAGLKDLYDNRQDLLGSSEQIVPLVVATAVAGIVGYASIAWLIHFLQKHGMWWFVAYRVVLGLVLIAARLAGTI